MVKDAELHAADDKKRRELIDVKNHGESLIHDAEKSLKEYGDKVSEADKSAIEGRGGRAEDRARGRGRRSDQGQDQRSDAGADEARRGDVQGPAGGGPGAAEGAAGGARPRTTSSTPNSRKSTTTRRNRPDEGEDASGFGRRPAYRRSATASATGQVARSRVNRFESGADLRASYFGLFIERHYLRWIDGAVSGREISAHGWIDRTTQ